MTVLRAGSLAALGLTIAAGFAGPPNPMLNVGMTLFWVCFLLAFTYLTLVVGDLYEWISPWKTLVAALHYAGMDVDRARLRYPRAASYWPAVLFYVALVWMELFALPRPFTLAVSLATYSVVTVAGVFAFGRDDLASVTARCSPCSSESSARWLRLSICRSQTTTLRGSCSGSRSRGHC